MSSTFDLESLLRRANRAIVEEVDAAAEPDHPTLKRHGRVAAELRRLLKSGDVVVRLTPKQLYDIVAALEWAENAGEPEDVTRAMRQGLARLSIVAQKRRQ